MPQLVLGAELAELIEQQMESGRYSAPSDVVRAGLRLLDEVDIARRRDEIRTELAARIADPAAFLPADEVFAAIRSAISERRES